MGKITARYSSILALLGVALLPNVALALDCEWISQTLLPESETVPASLPAILWTGRPTTQQIAEPSKIISFTRKDSAGAVSDVAFRIEAQTMTGLSGVKIVPTDSLVAGSTYRIVADPLNGSGLDPNKDFDVSEFTTQAAIPLPDSEDLGVVLSNGGIQHKNLSFIASGGGMVDFPAVYQDFAVELSAELKPWSAALIFETLVDGKRWKQPRPACHVRMGRSWHGRGVDRVFASCASEEANEYINSGVEPGTHTIEFRARLEGSSIEFKSNIVSVELNCETSGASGGSETGETDTGSSSSSGASSSTGGETGTQSSSATSADSTATQPGSSAVPGTPGASTPGTTSSPERGCSVASGAFPPGATALAFCLGLFGWRRRLRLPDQDKLPSS